MPQYEYANARLRAMRSRLLSPAQTLALADATSPQALLVALERTPYGPALSVAHGDSVERLEAALREALGRVFARLRRLFGPEEDAMAAAFFACDSDCLVLAPGFPAAGLPLDHPHHERARHDLLRAEGETEAIVGWLAIEADTANLLSLLRAFSPGGERPLATNRLLKPGRLSFERLRLASQQPDLAEALARFGDTLYSRALAAGLDAYRRSHRLDDIERQLRLLRLGRQAGLFATDPLGIGPLLAYVALLSAEVRNLRWLVRAISLGLSAAEARAELELVA